MNNLSKPLFSIHQGIFAEEQYIIHQGGWISFPKINNLYVLSCGMNLLILSKRKNDDLHIKLKSNDLD